jgi:1-acyl-sn-glycerol-3-phosphate acyltransferase
MKPLYFTLRMLTKGVFKVFYRHQVFGLRHLPKGAAIIAPTHTSYYDPAIIGISIPEEVHYLAKQELFSYPVFSQLIKRLNAHPVSGTTQDLGSFRLIGELIKQNKKVVIFPEGQRTADGHIATIKPGIAMLAQRNQCAILPVYLHGVFNVWPLQQRFPRPYGKIAVVIGSPIVPQHYWSSDKRRAQEEIARALELKLKSLENWYLQGCHGDPP